MAAIIAPHCQSVVLCDDAQRDPDSLLVTLHGVRTEMVAAAFPYSHQELCAYLELTGHEGTAAAFVVAVDALTDVEVFATPRHEVRFFGPLNLFQAIFRIRGCRFPRPGLYWIELYCSEQLVASHRLLLVERSA
ncbi:MAG: hypothetical protein HYS13_23900 [Planctomycetia bacterium]|nr:hypothetical protein [Planctomycetia bacterium]